MSATKNKNSFPFNLLTLLSNFFSGKKLYAENCLPVTSEVDYAIAVKFLADNRSTSEIANSGPQHATVIMSNIFRTAKEYVCILAGDLEGQVSNEEYVSQLVSFMEKDNTRLTVILEKNPTVNSQSKAIPKIKEFRDANPLNRERIKIGYAENIENLKFFGTELKHFTIADDRMYRLEVDTNRFIAVANFNDAAKVKELKGYFDSINFVSLN